MTAPYGYKDFQIGNLFEKINVKHPSYKAENCKKIPDKIYSLPVLTAGIDNQGLSGYIPYGNEDILKDCVSVSANGANTGAMFFQDSDFTVLQDSYAIQLKEQNGNRELYLYLITCMQKAIRGYYDWSNKAGWEKIKVLNIYLPVTPDGTPDFDYMTQYIAELETQYIAELETQYIAELETYLKVTGLDDYTLTDSDKDVLSRMADGQVPMGEFRIGDLFKKADIRNKKGFNKRIDASNVKTKEFNVPIINAKHGNNGIMFYGRDNDCNSIEGTIGVIQNGAIATGDVYPHPEKTGVLWDAYLIKPFYGMSTELLIYFSCAIQKAIKAQYSYDNKSYWELVQNNIIVIPITPNDTPDYAFMEQYIRAVEKQTIAKLYDSHAMEIQTAKEIINSDN